MHNMNLSFPLMPRLKWRCIPTETFSGHCITQDMLNAGITAHSKIRYKQQPHYKPSLYITSLMHEQCDLNFLSNNAKIRHNVHKARVHYIYIIS